MVVSAEASKPHQKWESLQSVTQIALDRARNQTPDPRSRTVRIPLSRIVLDEITEPGVVARKIRSDIKKGRVCW